jgi:hypothetical protein
MKLAAFPTVLLFVLAAGPGMADAASSPKAHSTESHRMGSPWGGGTVDLSLGSIYVGELGRDLRRHLDTAATGVDWRTTSDSAIGGSSAANIPSSIDAINLAGYTVYSLAAMPFTLLRGKAGLLYHEVTLADSCMIVTRCDAQEGVSSSIFGFGAAYHLGKNINILGGYTIVESDLSRLAIGLNFNFE